MRELKMFLELIRRASKAAPAMCLVMLGMVPAETRDWILSREIAPGEVMAHFPLQVGNRWIYETKYADGVGVIGEWNHHEGTYWDKTTTLKRFIPSAQSGK